MNLTGIFKKNPVQTDVQKISEKPEIPDDLFRKCPKCNKAVLTEEILTNHSVCPKCGGYFRMSARERIEMIADADSFEEWDTGLENRNPLRLKKYPERIKTLKETLDIDEAVITGLAKIAGTEVVLMAMDSRFLTASMGEVTGEKITRGVERATELKLPIIIFCCSGGARMQEGMISLMQMAKTSAALKAHDAAGLLYISVLTDPTMGGVTASFAMLGDIILAEPEALVGFAGPRVIEQTIRQKLPKGFQRSEFLLEHGFADMIVEREEMRETLDQILKMHCSKSALSDSKAEIHPFEMDSDKLKELKKAKTPWERVLLSRDKNRPVASDYIEGLFDGFMEFHGDRQFGDDPAVAGGIAWFDGQPVTVIAQMKGKDTKENLKRNFAMAKPEGYRKALRLMKQAEKFHRPILCLVDTSGAFCGIEAEERGQGEAIARNLFELSALKTPILSILIGEGGSGGALALAVADEVWIMENATYSILSPEGFASILWKDAKLAEKAAKVMRLTSFDLLQMGIVERIIEEPEEFQTENLEPVCEKIAEYMKEFLDKYSSMDTEELVTKRYQRFRKI
ncbi:MAG: acetyl-CoA carboxylase carboxyltransferase subunit alpha [Muricoprocola sp.]